MVFLSRLATVCRRVESSVDLYVFCRFLSKAGVGWGAEGKELGGVGEGWGGGWRPKSVRWASKQYTSGKPNEL